MDEMAAASQSSTAGSEGVAGVIESADGAKKYFVGDDGLEYTQLIEKGLMGACFYYQATAVYFGAGNLQIYRRKSSQVLVIGGQTERLCR